MRRKRVLVLHDTLAGWGTEKNLWHLGEFADPSALEVSYLLTAERCSEPPAAPGSTRVFRLRTPRIRVNRFTEALNFALKLIWSLSWLLGRRAQFDLLIASNPEECVIAYLASKLLLTKSKLVVYDQILLDLEPASRYMALVLRAFLAVNRRAHAVVCLSRGLCDHMATTHGVTSRMYVLPGCIDQAKIRVLSQEAVDEEWLLRDGRASVLYVGRLSNRQKRIDVLLEAVARLRNSATVAPFKLLLIGDGEDRDALERLATTLGLEGHVYFLGYKANPFKYYTMAALFVLSSDVEGFGNVILEAMASGLPVIATDCRTGPAEILDHGKWGELVPAGDSALLAERMARVLADEEFRSALRRRSLTRSGQYDCRKVFGEFTRICEEITGIGDEEKSA